MNQKLWLESLWDEWLASESLNADYESSGLLMGMKHKNESFTTNRIRAARRLNGLHGGRILRVFVSVFWGENVPAL